MNPSIEIRRSHDGKTANVRLPPAHGYGNDRHAVYTDVNAYEARAAAALFLEAAEQLEPTTGNAQGPTAWCLLHAPVPRGDAVPWDQNVSTACDIPECGKRAAYRSPQRLSRTGNVRLDALTVVKVSAFWDDGAEVVMADGTTVAMSVDVASRVVSACRAFGRAIRKGRVPSSGRVEA
ncbi:MAG: hypothetical protein L3K23_10395 [Thermoplasmata archaeon]|nr:hypothetical protein [Thermoplasmata archaeon]